MDKIHRQSFHQLYAKPILFVGVLLLLAGFYCYTQMQTNLFPEVLFPRITVIADAGQQPVDRMMITVAKPLESAVKKVQGTTVVKSSTSRGSCVIDVYFQWGLDIYALKTQLESRINEIKNFLPAGTVISTEAMNQSLFPCTASRWRATRTAALPCAMWATSWCAPCSRRSAASATWWCAAARRRSLSSSPTR